ncbi:MAG: hypothetical protein K0R63_1436 [Rickettsiales bacterium]|jgi:hypothetical protein|nr:hypothetical protein [Rickettsiales bacterium]
MLALELDAILDRLSDFFIPIYEHWNRGNMPASPLRRAVSGLNGYEVLSHDIKTLGIIAANLDTTGKRLELGLIVEALTYLARKHHPETKVEEIATSLTQELGVLEARNTGNVPLSNPELLIPLSLTVLKEEDKTREGMECIRAFVSILDAFILHDGKLSSEELGYIRRYEETLHRFIIER